MGNNFAFTVIEEQVIQLYNNGLLTLPILDTLCLALAGIDVDHGGSMDIITDDGKDFDQVCVELIKPDFVPNDDIDSEEYWSWADEFMELKDRWGWT